MRDFDPTASEFISSGYINKSVPGSGAFYDPVSIGTSLAIGTGSQLLAGAIGGEGAQQSAGISADAAMQGAQASAQGNENATANLYGMENTTRQDYSPYMQQGKVALSSLMGKINSGQLGGSFTGADYLANKDPGYQFQLDQGNQALQNSQAAHNGALSGEAMKSMIGYNQGMASTGYQNAYERWLGMQKNTAGQLGSVASMGQAATQSLGDIDRQYAGMITGTVTGQGNAMANGLTSAGDSRAAGVMGQANAWAGGISHAGNMMGAYALKDVMGGGRSNGLSSYDMGFNGQSNPANQAGLDKLIASF